MVWFSRSATDLPLFDSGRIKIIPFNRYFEEEEQDKGLKAFFAEEDNMSGIFSWLLEGYCLLSFGDFHITLFLSETAATMAPLPATSGNN